MELAALVEKKLDQDGNRKLVGFNSILPVRHIQQLEPYLWSECDQVLVTQQQITCDQCQCAQLLTQHSPVKQGKVYGLFTVKSI